jgi:hypothetical protein
LPPTIGTTAGGFTPARKLSFEHSIGACRPCSASRPRGVSAPVGLACSASLAQAAAIQLAIGDRFSEEPMKFSI